MNNFSEQFSKKISRGNFAIRYIPTTIIVFFITGGVWNADLSVAESLVLIVAGLYVILLCIQRLNDIELSKWYFLLSLIPIVNLVLGVILLTRKGKSASPKFDNKKETNIVDQERKSASSWLEKLGITDVTPSKIKKSSNIKYCGHCGAKHVNDAKFCSLCGMKFG
jgi:cell division protein FtsW (lipid II flippase)